MNITSLRSIKVTWLGVWATGMIVLAGVHTTMNTILLISGNNTSRRVEVAANNNHDDISSIKVELNRRKPLIEDLVRNVNTFNGQIENLKTKIDIQNANTTQP